MAKFRNLLINELEFDVDIFSEISSLDCFGGLLDRKLNLIVREGVPNSRLFSLNLPFRSLHLILLSLADENCKSYLRQVLLRMLKHRKAREKQRIATGGNKEAARQSDDLDFEGATLKYLHLLSNGSLEEERRMAVIYSLPVFRENHCLGKLFGRLLYEVGTAFLSIALTREGEEVPNKVTNWPIECLDIPWFCHPDAHASLMTRLVDVAG